MGQPSGRRLRDWPNRRVCRAFAGQATTKVGAAIQPPTPVSITIVFRERWIPNEVTVFWRPDLEFF